MDGHVGATYAPVGDDVGIRGVEIATPHLVTSSAMGKHEIQLDARMKASPTDVWAVLTDVKRYPEWMAHVKGVHVNGKGALKRGTLFRLTLEVGSHRVEDELEVALLEPPGRFGWIHKSGTFDGSPINAVSEGNTDFLLEPLNGGTRLAVHIVLVPHGLKATLGAGWFLNHKVKPQMEASLERLKRLVE